MTNWLSEPIERLLATTSAKVLTTDILIAGSGYGAAMAALAILERYAPSQKPEGAPPKVWVFEAGREYVPEDFPKTIAELPGFVSAGNLNSTALWDVRRGDGVISIAGRGLGGTSLVNANVAARVDPAVFDRWPDNNRVNWHHRLSAFYDKIENLLGVQRYPDIDLSSTCKALSNSARALGATLESAPLTINFTGAGIHSADHGPCNSCGNCVVGCHSGAKGSLNLNAWPLAKQMGAGLYTGVQVRSLRRNPDGTWQVICAPTGRPSAVFEVNAATVILAAGTLGSTEILKRSAQQGLSLSSRLGQKFSLNGDALVAAIGQQDRVGDPSSVPGEDPPRTAPGPTIAGMARVCLSETQKESAASWITIEDAQIPYALHQIWQEMIVSQALLRRFGDGSVSAWHQHNVSHDPLAISEELAAHTQTLLIMGHDDARGELKWEDDRLKPSWEHNNDTYYRALDQRLREDEKIVFNGGLYAPNLISQPLPPGFEDVLEGASQMQGLRLTVHPLGGCCIGSSSEDGVVNTDGQVFVGDPADNSAVYDNLYVMDGAVIPDAIGINPFLTIASLSYALASTLQIRRLTAGCDDADRIPLVNLQDFPPLEQYRSIPRGTRWQVTPDHKRAVEAVFRERLVCHLQKSHRSRMPWSATVDVTAEDVKTLLVDLPLPPAFNALVLDAQFEFRGEQSLDRWIRSPGTKLPATAELSADAGENVFTINNTALIPLATLSGFVRLGVGDNKQPGKIRRLHRTLGAVLRFLHFRSMDLLVKLPRSLVRLVLSRKTWAVRDSDLLKKSSRTIWRQLKEFWRIAGLQSSPRYLEYEFSNTTGLRFVGRKTLAYGFKQRDLLAALMTLPLEVQNKSRKQTMLFEMDTVRVTDGPSPLQITRSPDLPASVMAAGGLAMYFLRMIMNTHFWSFAAPAYKQFASRQELETTTRQGRFVEPPEFIFYGSGGKKQSLPREKFEHCVMQSGQLRPLARLVRYQPSDGDQNNRRALLLVHGLAHSSRVFWTDTLRCNFVQYFLEQNYDVWVLDHRASANYIRQINPHDKWDDIALDDVPWAVKTIFNQINLLAVPGQEKHVHVFSHCIGAGAVAMAVLAGKLNYEQRQLDGNFVQRSMLASLVPHAVTPWLHTSAENRARANVWAWVKELEPIQVIEPMSYRDPEFLELLYDRLAALAMTEDEREQWSLWRGFTDWRGPGFAQSIYTRYTIFWGRQWYNRNISAPTRYEFAGMIGPVPIGVMQQVYFSLTRGLLSDHEGGNSYVREAAFANHWNFPTLFLHGNRNTVFDQESSRHSADQLTRLRIRQHIGQRYDDALDPEQYARHQVWIEVLDNYGHMDMIFSKTADQEVYPRLHDFFTAAEKNALENLCQRRMALPGARDWFLLQCRARSAAVPVHKPRTGPVISSPRRVSDNTLRVRIWAEAEDFCVYAAEGISVRRVTGKSGKTRAQPAQHLPYSGLHHVTEYSESRVWPEEFWLHEVDLALPLTDALTLSIKMPGDVTTGTSAAIPGYEQVTLTWHPLPWFQRTADPYTATGSSLTLLVGSCLYPGLPFEKERSFNCFNAMRQHIFDDLQYGRGADGLLLLGDQIYADATADLFDPKAHYERYRNPYRLAFNQPGVAYVLSHLPTWFVVDDHEYRDNWRGLDDDGLRDEYEYARRMAGLYQMHQDSSWHLGRAKLWYSFNCAGYPIFVFDTRTERHFDAGAPSQLLDLSQLSAFEEWLGQQTTEVLILASGSPLGPVSRALLASPEIAESDDSLLAYPGFLAIVSKALAQHAANKKILWLTGDPHLSCVANLELETEGQRVSVVQICCSGLNAPLPFVNAQRGDYDWDTAFELPLKASKARVTIRGTQHLLTDNSQHFVRLDIDGSRNFALSVQAYDAAGEAVGTAFKSDWKHIQEVFK